MFICLDKYPFDCAWDPATRRWYLDTTSLKIYHLERFNKHIAVKDCFAVLLFHRSAFDLRVIENEKGVKAFFTVKDASEDRGDLYQSDEVGFGYKTIILYGIDCHNEPFDKKAKQYLLTEGLNGEWSVTVLSFPGKESFTDVKRIISECLSEEAAKEELKKEKGVNLNDNTVYTRIDEAYAEDFRKKQKELYYY